MIERPRLKGYLTLFPISEDVWGLRGGSDELTRVRLRDEEALQTFGALLPKLNGKRTRDELLDQLAEKGIGQEAAIDLLERLENASLLEEADSHGLTRADERHFSRQIHFFARFTSEGGAKHQATLKNSRVAVVGDSVLARCLIRHLHLSGLGAVVSLTPDGNLEDLPDQGDASNGGRYPTRFEALKLAPETIWPQGQTELPQVFIVAQETFDPRLMEAMDAFSKRHRVAWILVRALKSNGGWVGPFFIPDETACYLSLDARLKGNLPFFSEQQAFEAYLHENGRESSFCGGLHVCFELLSGVAVSEVVKYLTGVVVPQLAGRFLAINFSSWDTELHDVLKVPRIGLGGNKPVPFPWKEIPYEELESTRDDQIHTRRA